MILPDYTTAIQFIIFIVTALVLGRFLFQPIMSLFEEREKKTIGTQKEADSVKERADSLMAQYEADIERERRDAAGEREKIRQEASERSRNILEKAREESQKSVDEIRAKLGQELLSARESLRKDASELARQMALRLLGRPLLSISIVLLLVGLGWASEEEHKPFISFTLFWTVINFGIFMWILIHYLKTPIMDFFRERKTSISRTIEEATRRKSEEEERLRSISDRLSRIKEESARIHEDLRKEGEAERKKLIEETDRMALRIKGEAREVADAEAVKAMNALREEAAALASGLAVETIKKNFTDDDQSRLVGEYLSRLRRKLPQTR